VTSTICVIVPWKDPDSSRIADTVMSDQATPPSPVRYRLRVRRGCQIVCVSGLA
jgi:hypothetical protein